MYLILDTETTGFPINWKIAPTVDPENWPRIVEIAWSVVNFEEELLVHKSFLIKPENYVIPEASSKVHGITTKLASEEGRPEKEVLEELAFDALYCDFVVAHNIDFDAKVVHAAFLRQKLENGLAAHRKICTMKTTTSFCKIPFENGKGQKWPSLQELHSKLFGDLFKGDHRASADVKACTRCFFELQHRKIINL